MGCSLNIAKCAIRVIVVGQYQVISCYNISFHVQTEQIHLTVTLCMFQRTMTEEYECNNNVNKALNAHLCFRILIAQQWQSKQHDWREFLIVCLFAFWGFFPAVGRIEGFCTPSTLLHWRPAVIQPH